MKTLVTAGGGVPADANYVAAAATPTGTLLVVYVPPAHSGSITIDMTVMSGTAQASWFNPTTAAYTVIGTFPIQVRKHSVRLETTDRALRTGCFCSKSSDFLTIERSSQSKCGARI